MANRFGDIDVSFKHLSPVYGYHSQKLVSLEKALEPLVSQIDELPRYIKIAERHCHHPSKHGLTHDESAAIYIYTMEWDETSLYRVLNNALRSENREELKIWFPYLKLFDTALSKLPTVKEVIWRGVPLDIGQSFTKNQVVTWWSISSCSSSVDVIKTFLMNKHDSTLFLIEAKHGKKASGYTGFENEDEVILTLGTQLRVKSNSLEHPSGFNVVHLIEIDDNNDTQMTKTSAAEGYFSIGTRWKQNGITIVGEDDQLNELQHPDGIYIDDDDEQCIYIADCYHHRIVRWKFDEDHGQIVAGGNGEGNRMNQLNYPTDILIDRRNDSLIICDRDNKRVVQWPRRNGRKGEVIISDITCNGLAMDNRGYLYVSDNEKNEVRRWKLGDKKGTLVAGGNGKGSQRNQLNAPSYIFVDEDQSLYVSDTMNHRVMKWMKDAKEGSVVAGGQGKGSSLSQLDRPQGLLVDHIGSVFVADNYNHRVMRWSAGSKEVSVVVGGNGKGQRPNQFNHLAGLAFDRHGNLYVADWYNNRIQKFDIDFHRDT